MLERWISLVHKAILTVCNRIHARPQNSHSWNDVLHSEKKTAAVLDSEKDSLVTNRHTWGYQVYELANENKVQSTLHFLSVEVNTTWVGVKAPLWAWVSLADTITKAPTLPCSHSSSLLFDLQPLAKRGFYASARTSDKKWHADPCRSGFYSLEPKARP